MPINILKKKNSFYTKKDDRIAAVVVKHIFSFSLLH